jgi:hypothetical protein
LTTAVNKKEKEGAPNAVGKKSRKSRNSVRMRIVATAKVEMTMRPISLLVLLTVFMPSAAAQSVHDGKSW